MQENSGAALARDTAGLGGSARKLSAHARLRTPGPAHCRCRAPPGRRSAAV